jgi:hypothetical protein
LTEARAANHAAPTNHSGLIWAIADLLRGDYKRSEYGRVILPLVLLRRLDCVLEPTKARVLARAAALAGTVVNVDPILKATTGIEAYNTSRLNLRAILADPTQIAGNLRAWIAAFDAETRFKRLPAGLLGRQPRSALRSRERQASRLRARSGRPARARWS